MNRETLQQRRVCSQRGHAAGCRFVVLFLLCCSAFIFHPSSFVFASDYNVNTDYRNWWVTPSPAGGPYTNYYGSWPDGAQTNASTAVYYGHALGNTNSTSPSNAAFRLVQSAFGQPVEGLQADVALGDVIDPPPGTDTNQPPWNFAAVQVGNNPAAYYECQDPVGGAFWVPSTKEVIAAQPNNVEIDWRTTNGTTNVQILLVGAVPSSRPARLFWTEPPYDAPPVNLDGYFPVVHYNSEVTRPVYEVTTNVDHGVTNYTSNVVSGVWLDNQKRLRAMEVSGMFLLEYYEAGTYSQQVQPVGIEIVQVLEPDVLLQTADIGERLLPQDNYWSQVDGNDDLDAFVSQGLTETAYRFDHVGPKQGWVFAIKRTVDAPWALEIYWRHPGVMGILWPFEYDWYACDWPEHPQLRVVSASTQTTAAVLVPAELTGQLMDYMDPPLHASLSVSGKSLMMTEPGYCLMKYTTHDDIWFEVIRSVARTNTAAFDLTALDWDIGEELRPPELEAHALAFDGVDDHVSFGTSWLNKQVNWTLALWFQEAAAGAGSLYTEGLVGPTLEINTESNGGIYIGVWNEDIAGRWEHCHTPNGLVEAGAWQHLAVTLENGDDASNGTLRIYLDGAEVASTNMSRLHFEGAERGSMAAGMHWPSGLATNFFHGRMDEVRIWTRTLSPAEIESNRYELAEGSSEGLVANYTFDEGTGSVVHNEAGGYAGTISNSPVWCYGQIDPDVDYAEFPGYIYEPFGNRYNVDLYNYPTESNPDADSYVFAVNTNTLEVWWANPSQQAGMPAAVYYPSWVGRYNCTWPTGMPQIVIASGLGSQGGQLTDADDALEFDGAGDVSVVGHDDVFAAAEALTLEAWVRPASVTGLVNIVTKGADLPLPTGFMLGVSNGTFRAWFADMLNNRYELSWGSPATGAWTHVAATIERGGLMAGYMNGKLAVQTAGPTEALNPAGSALAIGANSGLAGAFFDGRIGEVRIWNTARTPAQIQGLWLSRPAGNEAGLVACYPFERGTNETVLADIGTNGMDGTVTDAQWVQPGHPVAFSDAMLLADDSIYVQNDSSQPGFNPNEEHALVLDGVAYALRDDLNTNNTSAPYVLVDYLDAETARPKMALYGVVRTNIQYPLRYSLDAGLPIQPPLPLGAMPPCTNTTSPTQPPAWPDRKHEWWACSAGDNGWSTNAVMNFYYAMQPGFWFPGLSATNQPAVGTELPWLPTPSSAHGTAGTPTGVVYDITWPENLPAMKIGQTLTRAAEGLPDVWDQLSVESVYQQSVQLGQGDCVVLFDPVTATGAPLSNNVVEAMTEAGLATRDLTDTRTRFGSLPPSLYPRMYYDPDRGDYGELVLEGVYEETLTGGGYLLLNLLADFERDQAVAAASGIDAGLWSQWSAAVNALPQTATDIQPNEPFVHAAAYAGQGEGTGYVTLAFNNSTNPIQVPPSLPVSLSIFQVEPELAEGMVEVIEPPDVLDEQLTLRTSLDFGGDLDEYEFEWRWTDPEGGLVPNTNFDSWSAYGTAPAPGSNVVTIAGASEFTLTDHYFAMRYRKIDDSGPTGTNWSGWTYNLAPGWVQRVMNGINPFEQCLQDTLAYAVDTRSTMISLAGEPYQGDIALNLAAACDGGLIPTYQTVLNRAMDFSILAGATNDNACQTLLFAASRLNDLYMLLGNEAYADAQDPTLAFPRALWEDEHGAEATSIFCFMNQMPNLLEEELALLRGRDDTLEPSVELAPVYNRLIWNFTKGINGGEAAYAYTYNIKGAPTSTVGTITAEDAARLYPQGHGDAWGHYQSALMGYYNLLSSPNFGWHTEPGATLLGNATVSTDFFDEQKFAEAAAAKARTGVEIMDRTCRKSYEEAPTARWAGYRDSNTNRVWGLAGWGSRTGQGAYYDWATANSLLLDNLTNMVQVGGSNLPPEGIQKIDRTTVPELREIAEGLAAVQRQIDNADGGLNPLGLGSGVVPFDISPTEIDEGKTHFEQIYDRALQALYNACVAFDYARNVTLKMREQFDSVYALQEQLAANEIEFHNQLIGLFGYPYPDDIGPTGTYPQDYNGPDLVNWQILDLEDLVYNAPTGQPMSVKIYNYVFTAGNDFSGTNYTDYTNLPSSYNQESSVAGTVTVSIADSGLKVKPADWTGRRPAQGELQLALADVVQSWYALEAKIADYNQTLYALEVEMQHREADYSRLPTEWSNVVQNAERENSTAHIIGGLKIAKNTVEAVAELVTAISTAIAHGFPDEIEGITGVYVEENISGAAAAWATVPKWIQFLVANGFESGIAAREMQQARWDADLEKLIANNEYQDLLHWATAELLADLKAQYVKQAELLEQVQALAQQVEQVGKLLAEAELLLVQRQQVRARAGLRIQMNRYQDLAFRIFRDDALRRYRETFDLAARYVYLAAKAYDYETGLLGDDTQLTPGSRFLEDIVKARLPGRFYVWLGEPETGIDEGEPGLADIMARMKADWEVVEGRFGFNNPDTETSRFSLRSEHFRISPASASDGKWATTLENECKVDDLRALPEFVRHCIPFNDTTNEEPGLVIPFSTMVVAGKNYFGQDLAGGDNAYDPTHQATKVRSAGIWFTGYNVTFNTNDIGPGLANEPRVYLIPVGEDIMRSPTREGLETRSWKVLDQALPLPYNIGASDLNDPDFQPLMDSLTEPLARIRRFASLRAYHDRGQFVEEETHNNGRLIGRSVWNTQWLLIIPGRTLLADPEEGIERFIHGAKDAYDVRDGNGIKDVKIFFQTYSIAGE